MSLARRAALQTRTRAILAAPASQKRCLAHDAHAHEHEQEHDAALYPPEPGTFIHPSPPSILLITFVGFWTPAWRNFFVAATVGVLAYNYAPAPSSELYLTRYMDKYKEDVDSIVETNVNHAMHSTLMSDNQEFFKKHQKRVARRSPQNACVSASFQARRFAY